LARIARQRDNVRILIGGLRQLYDTINLPEGKKAFVPFVPFEDYPGLINNFDIGLAPLCGSYDSRRSWLKPLEYMTMKIPWIGSDNIAYRELLEYGCLVKNEPLEWERAITHTIDRIDTFRKMAAMAPYEFAVKQDADARVDDILGVFEEIYSKSKGK
jgi:glycosyltransferase involved in cell wall biosynthesis